MLVWNSLGNAKLTLLWTCIVILFDTKRTLVCYIGMVRTRIHSSHWEPVFERQDERKITLLQISSQYWSFCKLKDHFCCMMCTHTWPAPTSTTSFAPVSFAVPAINAARIPICALNYTRLLITGSISTVILRKLSYYHMEACKLVDTLRESFCNTLKPCKDIAKKIKSTKP